MKTLFSTTLLFFCSVTQAVANTGYKNCLLQADNFYEQLYCEVKAKGEGRNLPSFIDFKKNNELTQALLIKRHAMALSLPFSMPKSSSSKKSVRTKQDTIAEQMSYAPQPSCSYEKTLIRCEGKDFTLTGNLKNKHLTEYVLSAQNRMAMPAYTGSNNDMNTLRQYLSTAYERYIEKMIAIGLAGSTMSFTKFYYLYQDITEKGVNFSLRFETMYEYLKQDKKTLGVNTQIKALDGLGIEHCNRINERIYTCDNGKHNRVYLGT